MPFLLSQRDTCSRERMDDPQSNLEELKNTYRQFKIINALLGRWRRIYNIMIRPRLSTTHPHSLLDIGFGGGDIPRRLAQWAAQDGVLLNITAIDPDPRAYSFAINHDNDQGINFKNCRLADLDPSAHTFDFIISNHLLHHLKDEELFTLLNKTKKMCRHAAIFNDLRRSDASYLLFNALARPFFRNSMIVDDGLTSIKRSYTFEELSELIPNHWKVKSFFPFRLLLIYHAK
jgi:2-polyprenyl-3-methyl-5-hydroxy-6-metoxy-1,4-benzoquinol methylase